MIIEDNCLCFSHSCSFKNWQIDVEMLCACSAYKLPLKRCAIFVIKRCPLFYRCQRLSRSRTSKPTDYTGPFHLDLVTTNKNYAFSITFWFWEWARHYTLGAWPERGDIFLRDCERQRQSNWWLLMNSLRLQCWKIMIVFSRSYEGKLYNG